jgi:quaternary ammonium compound-resistance protein SugE
MPWTLLIIAGFIEAGWAIGLKYTDGFTKPLPSILTGLGIAVSLYLLSVATKTIPIGTAYAVWVGIGTTGAIVLGMLLFKEPVTALRGVFLAMMLASIIGLKATSPE